MNTKTYHRLSFVIFCLGLVACGNYNNDSSITDSSALSRQVIDSTENNAPAAGMGPGLRPDTAGITSASKDSVVRMGGGATSIGDSTRQR